MPECDPTGKSLIHKVGFSNTASSINRYKFRTAAFK